MKVFLDDVRTPRIGEAWDYIVRSYEAFVALIQKHGCPEEVSFDHDLAPSHYENLEAAAAGEMEEKTGYDAAKFLSSLGCIPKSVLVHSWNPAGAQNIANVFRGKTKVVVKPY